MVRCEQGVELVSTSWFELSGPAGPAPAVVEPLAQAETRARFAEFGGDPGALTPAGDTALAAAECAAWVPAVRESGATVD